MISVGDLEEVLGTRGLGYPTLAQHGAVCPSGFAVVCDENGDEVCVRAGAAGLGASRNPSGDRNLIFALAQNAQERAAFGDLKGAQQIADEAASRWIAAGRPQDLQSVVQRGHEAAYDTQSPRATVQVVPTGLPNDYGPIGGGQSTKQPVAVASRGLGRRLGLGDASSDQVTLTFVQQASDRAHKDIESGLPLAAVDKDLTAAENFAAGIDQNGSPDIYAQAQSLIASAQADRDNYANIGGASAPGAQIVSADINAAVTAQQQANVQSAMQQDPSLLGWVQSAMGSLGDVPLSAASSMFPTLGALAAFAPNMTLSQAYSLGTTAAAALTGAAVGAVKTAVKSAGNALGGAVATVVTPIKRGALGASIGAVVAGSVAGIATKSTKGGLVGGIVGGIIGGIVGASTGGAS